MESLAASLEKTFGELMELVSSFSREDINQLPFEGSWTAAQVARHLKKSHSGFLQLMTGPVEDTHRPIDEWLSRIQSDFMDFSNKTTSPDFVLPEEKEFRREELIASLDRTCRQIVDLVQKADLSKTCTGFDLPVYGKLTRLEAAGFVLYHTIRHMHQLKNIQQLLKEKKTEYGKESIS